MSDMVFASRVDDSGSDSYQHRLLIATPATGLVRIEWCLGRYGITIPCNWSAVQMIEGLSTYVALRYELADAQNLIVQQCIEGKFRWLLLIEHDTIPPVDCFLRLNPYMRDEEIPVISGLYYSRSRPSEPLIYRGRGNSFYGDWKPGDLVWCDGVPTGLLLIHSRLLKAVWDDSPEYAVKGRICRRVFDVPQEAWFDPESNQFQAQTGTTDLAFCERVMKGDYLRRAGFAKCADEHPEFPFLVDTGILAVHIDMDGARYP